MVNENAKTLGELIPDMKRYLEHDCYCPGEVYSFDGFFYQIFSIDDEIKYIGISDKKTFYKEYPSAIVIALKEDVQILLIAFDEESKKIVDICRVDATENNIKLVTELVKNGKSELKFNEYKEGETAKSINEILKISNGLVICD